MFAIKDYLLIMTLKSVIEVSHLFGLYCFIYMGSKLVTISPSGSWAVEYANCISPVK